MTPREERWEWVVNAWINLAQSGEYDRIVRYMLKRVGEGKRSIVSDTLSGAKQLAMNIRRGSAVTGGVVAGLAASEVLPEVVQFISPTVAIISVAALGLNFGIDRLMDKELEENK